MREDPGGRAEQPAEEPVVCLDDVSRRWLPGPLGPRAAVLALEHCSLRLQPGEVVAVTGPAGCGKTTLLLIASGRVLPSSGTVRWLGSRAPELARAQLIGPRPWEYGFLTVRQALAFHADVLSLREAALPTPTRFLPLMRDVGLRGQSRTRLGALRPLDQLRVVIAQALLAQPRLLCLDDPYVFCSREERGEAAALLRRLAGRGLAVLVAGRDAAACGGEAAVDRELSLRLGTLVSSGHRSRSVLELSVPSPVEAMARLLPQLPSVARRGRRLRVPLADLSPEAVLATCRAVGVRVRASRVAEEWSHTGTQDAPATHPEALPVEADAP